MVVAIVVGVILGTVMGLGKGSGGLVGRLISIVWIAIVGINLFGSGLGALAGLNINTGFIAATSIVIIEIVFAMLMRVPEFVLEGDSLVAMQNARALHRMMNIMRETGAPNV